MPIPSKNELSLAPNNLTMKTLMEEQRDSIQGSGKAYSTDTEYERYDTCIFEDKEYISIYNVGDTKHIGNQPNTSPTFWQDITEFYNIYIKTESDNLLDDKVDKVTSNDNAIARFNGSNGQIQNSLQSISDSGIIQWDVTIENGIEYFDIDLLGVPDTSFSSTGARIYPDGSIRVKTSIENYLQLANGITIDNYSIFFDILIDISGETDIRSLASHTDGYVYAGTFPNGKIVRSNNGTTWTEVANISGETYILSLASHTDGYVYAGTFPNGKIVRSNDGTTWTEVANISGETDIRSLASHTDGYIYAGTASNGKIVRSNNGTTWTEVANILGETDIRSLASHTDGYVYAGTYPNGKIVRSNDGTTWTEVANISGETEIPSLASHTDGYVYAGTYPNGKIVRSNNGTTWTEVANISGETYIPSLASHTDGYVYAGTFPNGKIVRSNDGTTWTEVANISGETYIRSLASHIDGYVYAGTASNGKIVRSNKVKVLGD